MIDTCILLENVDMIEETRNLIFRVSEKGVVLSNVNTQPLKFAEVGKEQLDYF